MQGRGYGSTLIRFKGRTRSFLYIIDLKESLVVTVQQEDIRQGKMVYSDLGLISVLLREV
jgi:hypothetical protein